MKKMVLAGIIGGIIIFIWGAISHTVLPIGEAGFSQLANEDSLLQSLQGNIDRPGMYFFPWVDHHAGKEARQAWEQKYKSGPHGLLIYSPTGNEPMPPSTLLIELFTDIVAALIAAFLLSKISGTFRGRVTAVMLMGLFAWVAISWPYWNWYEFPASFTLAEGIDQVVGWFLAGLAMAKIMKPSEAT